MTSKEFLVEAIEQGRAVFVVGTGLSASATEGAKTATWHGLIRSGIEFVNNARDPRDEQWAEMVERTLAYAEDRDDSNSSVQAAGMVETAVKDLGEQAFANWLDETVAALELKDDSLIRALSPCQLPF